MKKYEYKMINGKTKLGFDYDKKVAEMEAEWNQLGLAGWKFCTWANDAMVFVREIDGAGLSESDS